MYITLIVRKKHSKTLITFTYNLIFFQKLSNQPELPCLFFSFRVVEEELVLAEPAGQGDGYDQQHHDGGEASGAWNRSYDRELQR
jgi:hypothetical protein